MSKLKKRLCATWVMSYNRPGLLNLYTIRATVTVGVAKTISFSYTITLSTCPINVGYDIKNLIVMQKQEL